MDHAASEGAIAEPTSVSLPYSHIYPLGHPNSGTAGDNSGPGGESAVAAVGLAVPLQRGQRVDIVAEVAGGAPAPVFVDVYERGDAGPEHESGHMHAAQYEAMRDREVIIRLQPQLAANGSLRVRLRAAPALRFPVTGANGRNVQSVWGDPRDGGGRRHEGVDIFAARGTDVVSASSGVVVRVGETGLGGNVVWVWDVSRGLRFYYAHLEEQRVSTGDRVQRGDVIGTVGNTGNARTTPPHLHFGIYARGEGAIDPYWFIIDPANARRTRR